MFIKLYTIQCDECNTMQEASYLSEREAEIEAELDEWYVDGYKHLCPEHAPKEEEE